MNSCQIQTRDLLRDTVAYKHSSHSVVPGSFLPESNAHTAAGGPAKTASDRLAQRKSQDRYAQQNSCNCVPGLFHVAALCAFKYFADCPPLLTVNGPHQAPPRQSTARRTQAGRCPEAGLRSRHGPDCGRCA